MTGERLAIGIDPGGKSTGIIAALATNRLRDLMFATTVISDGGKQLPQSDYLGMVVATIRKLIDDADNAGLPHVIGVEGLIHPNPRLGIANVMGLLGTAAVHGHVIGTFPQAIEIEPGHNGSQAMITYPDRLKPTRGGKGKDGLRHLRSAWDIAQKAVTASRANPSLGVPVQIGG